MGGSASIGAKCFRSEQGPYDSGNLPRADRINLNVERLPVQKFLLIITTFRSIRLVVRKLVLSFRSRTAFALLFPTLPKPYFGTTLLRLRLPTRSTSATYQPSKFKFRIHQSHVATDRHEHNSTFDVVWAAPALQVMMVQEFVGRNLFSICILIRLFRRASIPVSPVVVPLSRTSMTTLRFSAMHEQHRGMAVQFQNDAANLAVQPPALPRVTLCTARDSP